MKILVRALVLALAITGAFASTHANASSATVQAVPAKTSAMPIPTCPPDDPDGCGILQS